MTTATLTLSTGTSLPALAWGCGSGKAKTSALASGKVALDAGFEHIDTAQIYFTEDAVGEVIKEHASLKKDDIYVTSKLSQKSPHQGSKDLSPLEPSEVRASVEASVAKLGFTPDLFLIHNPFVAPSSSALKQTWQILEGLKDEGILKDIGVSNFRPQDLELILDGAKHPPVVNQLEYHPYVLTHLEPVLALHKKHNILTAAYGPLTPILRHPSGGPLKPVLTRIANRISKDHSELPVKVDEIAVLLLWTRAQGVLAVTASGTPDNIRTLAKIGKLPDNLLTAEEVKEIEEVGKKVHFRHYREHMEVEFALPNLPDGTESEAGA